jgi:hypothetical protein
MIFGRLNDVFENENSILESIQQQDADYKKPSFVSELLTKLSRYGMTYSEDVYKNMHALPANPDLIPKSFDQINNIYGSMIDKSDYRVKGEEDKPYNEKTLPQRLQVLRKMAGQPEIENILDIMANESIVYDSEQAYICQPYLDTAVVQMLSEENAEKIRNSVDTNFTKLYMLLDWKRNAWNIYKKYLIDGTLAYEILYDNIENPHTIIGIVELDPSTLTKSYEDGQIYWYQFKNVQGRERKLVDAQIIYIKYEDSGVIERTSYLERLIRPFNIYRIIEQAQIIWTVTQASFKTMFTIPVNGMNRAKGTQTLMSAMNRYKEDISFNSDTGELLINGKMNQPFNKEYWMPENENGTPQIETLVDNGPSLGDNEQLRFFATKLYKMSNIPENRFDKEAQTTWFGSDATQQLRDEINFSRFVERTRNPFAEIMLKPLRISVALSIPDMKNDKRILDSISLQFNSYNQFEEMAGIEVDTKRIEFISNMSQSLVTMDGEGNEKPFFSLKFLIMKYLKMSDADLELNEKYKFEEQIEAGNAENDESMENPDEEMTGDELMGGDDSAEGGEDFGSGAEESDEAGGLDSEILNSDVKPE